MPKPFLRFLYPKAGDDWTKPITAMLAVLGFFWGAWTFTFKEILIPAVAPVNISLDLEIKRLEPLSQAAGIPQASGDPLPVLLKASAKNASPKILSIRKTFWVAYATTLPRLFQTKKDCGPGRDDKSPIFPSPLSPDSLSERETAAKNECELKVIGDVNSQMSLGKAQLSLEGTSASWFQGGKDAWTLIGFGSLFDGNEIRPNEEIKSQRLVLVPILSQPNDYKILKVRVVIPSYSKRSNLADEDLIRVVGGISKVPSKDFVGVGFCQAERAWKTHNLRWFFDKFALPRDRFDDEVFREPAAQYCPTLMTPYQREKIGAQVFTSVYEIPLNVQEKASK